MIFLKGSGKNTKNTPSASHEGQDNENEISGNSTNTDNNSEQIREIFEEEVFTARMINFIRECAIFFFFMGAYVALTQNSPPKISNGPAAYPFFPKGSYVTDWYRGEISQAIEHARMSDMAFVMFYAPWDAESQSARKEFELAAKYMHGRVAFVSVNCWQPGGECRSQYSKVYGWPVFIVYPSFGRGVQYNGPYLAGHMIHFLKKVCAPIKRLYNGTQDFEEGYVVAELNTNPGSKDFAVFYTTALKYLEKDPYYRLEFYVKPSKRSNLTLTLNLWNESKTSRVFSEKDWKPDNILQWIFNNVNQASTWIAPTGSKGSILSNNLHSEPALILFTPKNPLQQHIDYYNMLQEVAQEFHKCDNYTVAFNMRTKRINNFMQHTYFENICKIKEKPSQVRIISHKLWANSSNCASATSANGEGCSVAIKKNVGYVCYESTNENCVEFLNNKDKLCKHSKFDMTGKNIQTSMIKSEGDRQSMTNLRKLQEKEKCRQFLSAQKIHGAVFESSHFPVSKVNITGLGCNTNRTLRFLAMDSLLFYHFAERLGVDLSKRPDKSAAVIIDDNMETHYILDKSVTGETLRQFVQKYISNNLKRSLNSSTSIKSRNTHSYDVKNHSENIYSINELDSNTFLPAVLQSNKAVVVLYYSKQCSFCNGVSYIFLMVARTFKYVENIMFTRIDGEQNILPWEFTMEKYPRILFFPPLNKAESTVFPSDIQITVPNLIWFVLSNLEPNLKLHAMWSLCNQTQNQIERTKCFSMAQRETLIIIENTLKIWRLSNKRQKQIILYNLKQLKQLHLLFGSSPKNEKLIRTYFGKLNNRKSEDYEGI